MPFLKEYGKSRLFAQQKPHPSVYLNGHTVHYHLQALKGIELIRGVSVDRPFTFKNPGPASTPEIK